MPAIHPSVSDLGEREREFASLIWRKGKIGRREIHLLTGVHPNLTGNAVSTLIESGLVREGEMPAAVDRGRPQVPVEIDPDRRVFLGLSIAPGKVQIARLDPTGKTRGEEITKTVAKHRRIVDVAAEMLAEELNPSVFSIGVSFTGLLDLNQHEILFSSSVPSASAISLKPIFDIAGDCPIILHNDMHALSMRWLLTSDAKSNDVLLVGALDGSVGASVLTGGKPLHGSVSGANELGHTRLGIETDRCYCGQTGCLERIFSSSQLAHFGSKSSRTLDEVLADPSSDTSALARLLDHFTTGLANAVNFVRPAQLVLASPFVRHSMLTDFLKKELPPRILPGLREHVDLIFWQQSNVQSAENAAWLAMADVFGHRVNRV